MSSQGLYHYVRVMQYLESYMEEAERMNERRQNYTFPKMEKTLQQKKIYGTL